MAEAKYNESSIQILEGLDAVRKRPGMYIGSTDRRGLHHLVYEIFDNAVDEALNGYGDTINISILEGDGIRIRDYGRGVPVGMHESGKSTPEIIFTVLHAGGKFGQGGYKSTGGLHGVGAAVVNALSRKLTVRIFKDGEEYKLDFENGGKVLNPLTKIGKTKEPQGTEVTFYPDKEIFTQLKYNFDTVAERLRESAFLMKGMKISLQDLRREDGKKEEFYYENGLADFVEYLNMDKTTISPVQFFTGENNDIELDIGIQWNDSYTETVLSFVNNVRTKDGGTHETGFKTALTRAVNDVAREKEYLKKKDKNLEGGDIREGLVGIISVRIPEDILEFEGQTKSKLGTSEARSVVDNFFYERIKRYMVENPSVAEHLISKAIKAQQVREEAKKARDSARGKTKGRKRNALSGKLTDATSKKREECELFLVEGDSAGGTANGARDRKTQAVLKMRGKSLNTEGMRTSEIEKNEEIRLIIDAIGAGVGEDFELESARYGKVIVMTDADVDGSHIQTLILTFIYRHMPKLIEDGRVYIAKPPLYQVTKGKESRYLWTQTELKELLEEWGEGCTVHRFKGLGEMNDVQLEETTMSPEGRVLIRVRLTDVVLADKIFSTLMGSNVAVRKEWIIDNVDFELDE